jgi:hypothetical protein
MSDKVGHPRYSDGSGRREFLKMTGAATVIGLAGVDLFMGSARGDAVWSKTETAEGPIVDSASQSLPKRQSWDNV